MERGILAYNTAGIEGPWQGGIVSIAPWMLSIVASSTDCRIVDKVVLGNGTTLKVMLLINSFALNGTKFPLKYGKTVEVNVMNQVLCKFCSRVNIDPKFHQRGNARINGIVFHFRDCEGLFRQ